MIEIRLAEYVVQLRDGTVNTRGSPDATCPTCRHPTALIIRAKGTSYCPRCVSLSRQCARCKQWKSALDFDVAKHKHLGLRIESYCVDCRRARNRDQYERAQQSDRPLVSHQVCVTCGKDKPRRAFYVDRRMTGGLEHQCKRCRNGAWQEYIQTPNGREAFDAAQKKYRRGRRRT